MTLTAVADGLWVASQPLRFFGAEIGSRMTCVRLASGAVVAHSPIRAEDEVVTAVESLGPVGWLVAPNAFHHLFLNAWRERLSSAEILVAPRLLKKRRDLRGARTLETPPAEWGDELEVHRMDGLPALDEHVFFHRPSGSLILTDLAFHFPRHSPFLTRWLIRLSGRLGELAPTALERLLVRDRAALRSSVERVLEWPFDRVIVGHGDLLETGGRAALRRGFDWLL